MPQNDLCHIPLQVTALNSEDPAGLWLRTDRQGETCTWKPGNFTVEKKNVFTTTM